jgi:hypothetical protein
MRDTYTNADPHTHTDARADTKLCDHSHTRRQAHGCEFADGRYWSQHTSSEHRGSDVTDLHANSNCVTVTVATIVRDPFKCAN